MPTDPSSNAGPARSPQPGAALAARTGFYSGLKQAVRAHLKERGLHPIDQAGMLRKALINYSLWTCCYLAFLYLGRYHGWHGLWMVVPGVFSLLCIVLSVMHDGSHEAFGRSRWLNRLAAWSLGFAGASPILWHKGHVQAHHGNTNVRGFDQDFETNGLIRLHPAQPWRRAHRYQHVYAWFLYCMHSLKWIWWDDCSEYLSNRWSLTPKRRRALLIEIVVAKSWHLVCYFVVPILVTQNVALVLSFYVLHWLLMGLVLVLTFLMAHITGVQETPCSREQVHRDWALHQLATTANFATGNWLLTWVVGGLNFQIEHHIFPKMSHTRHPLVHHVVKDYCGMRGVPYLEYPSFRSVLHAHYRNLKQLGTPPAEPAAAVAGRS